MGKWTQAARLCRKKLDRAVGYLSDEQALTVPGLYRSWQELAERGETAAEGFRFRHGEQLYKTRQPEYTFTPLHVPGAPGTESLFQPLEEGHAGTYADPIPYGIGQELTEGLYYVQYGQRWLCIRSSGTALYHDLAQLAGVYVERAESEEGGNE